jgi:hypothetical protein
MKRNVSILKTLLVTLPSLGLFLAPNSVWAGSRVYDAIDTCTGTNCNAVFLNGTPQRNANGDSDPFTLQIFSNGNECIRLDLTYQETNPGSTAADLEITLVSPSGRVWWNDDRNGATDRKPLIKAITDVDGFYTLQINQYNGAQSINSVQGFTLAYGRYNNTNSNCSSATAPIFGGSSPK